MKQKNVFLILILCFFLIAPLYLESCRGYVDFFIETTDGQTCTGKTTHALTALDVIRDAESVCPEFSAKLVYYEQFHSDYLEMIVYHGLLNQKCWGFRVNCVESIEISADIYPVEPGDFVSWYCGEESELAQKIRKENSQCL